MTLDSTAKENELTEATEAEDQVTDIDTSVAEVADENTVDSSSTNDEDAKEPESILDAVTAAIEEEAAEASSSPRESSEEAEEAEATDDNPPFHEHPRWKEMISERDGYKQSHEELSGLKGYMTNAGLSTDEVNNGFEIMRLIKHDPAQALAALKPYVDQLEQITGVHLSSDIQERVDEGYLDEDSARELSELRSRNTLATQASERATAEANTIRQQTQVTQHADQVSSAVSEWENKWSSTDPDYKLKQPKVMEKIELNLLKYGPPKTREQAVELAESCRQQVNADFTALRPRKGEVKPITGGSSPKSTAEPTTLMEAINAGLAKAS